MFEQLNWLVISFLDSHKLFVIILNKSEFFCISSYWQTDCCWHSWQMSLFWRSYNYHVLPKLSKKYFNN